MVAVSRVVYEYAVSGATHNKKHFKNMSNLGSLRFQESVNYAKAELKSGSELVIKSVPVCCLYFVDVVFLSFLKSCRKFDRL